MPYKIPRSCEIQRLTRTVASKLNQLQRLQQQQEALLHKHALLTSTCQALEVLYEASVWDQKPVSADDEILQSLEESLRSIPFPDALEAVTLDRVDDSPLHCSSPLYSSPSLDFSCSFGMSPLPSSDSHQNYVASQPVAPDSEPIAPASDPLRLLSHLLFHQQQLPDAHTLTMDELKAEYRCCVRQLASNINLLGSSSSSGNGNCALASYAGSSRLLYSNSPLLSPIEAIKAALSRHLAIMNSLLLFGRCDLTEAFMLSSDVSAAQRDQHVAELHTHALRKICLSKQQQRRICSAMDFFRQLLGPILAARQQQQVLLQLFTGSYSPAETAPPLPAAPAIFHQRGFARQCAVLLQQEQFRQLQQQQQLQLARMQQILRKEGLIRHCAAVCVWGCLSWKQLAQVFICCFPHPASPLALADAVEQQTAAEAAAKVTSAAAMAEV